MSRLLDLYYDRQLRQQVQSLSLLVFLGFTQYLLAAVEQVGGVVEVQVRLVAVVAAEM
jgi:hypothetical protein